MRRATAILVPEPMAPSATPVRVTDERLGRVLRAYVECRQDRAIPLSLQRRMHQAVRCKETFSLDTSQPFFSAPRELTEIIAATAARTTPDQQPERPDT